MKNIQLYHGSRTGIIGPIQPKSRPNCDFGSGFYMGTKIEQVRSLIYNEKNPMLYTIDLHLENIPDNRILTLSGMDWAFYVLYNRNKLEKIKDTLLYKKISELGNNKDVIIGPIADDNLNSVMKDFTKGKFTDKIFLESIRCIDYGVQYVAKTNVACQQAIISSEKKLDLTLYDEYQTYRTDRRTENNQKIEIINELYNGEGKNLKQILNEYQNQDPTEYIISPTPKRKSLASIPSTIYIDKTPEQRKTVLDIVATEINRKFTPMEQLYTYIVTHPAFKSNIMQIRFTGETIAISQPNKHIDSTMRFGTYTSGFSNNPQTIKKSTPELYELAIIAQQKWKQLFPDDIMILPRLGPTEEEIIKEALKEKPKTVTHDNEIQEKSTQPLGTTNQEKNNISYNKPTTKRYSSYNHPDDNDDKPDTPDDDYDFNK